MLENLPGALGHALTDVRAGLDQIAFNTLGLREGLAAIQVSSLAFADHAPIPARYTADGEGGSPPIAWNQVPAATASIILLVEDADSPTPHPLVHAIVAGLEGVDGALAEDFIGDQGVATGLKIGRNSMLRAAWLPPDPPPGHGVHRYAFQIFALSTIPELGDTPGREEILAALREHATASGLLIGTYERPDGSIKVGDATSVESGSLETSPSNAAN